MTAGRNGIEWPSDQELLAEIEAVSQDSATVQHQVLQGILEKHGSCHYLQNLGLDERTTLETFKARVPLSTAKDYIDDFEKLLHGNREPLLCCSFPIAFVRSSGTSAGKTKYFPVTKESGNGNLLLTYPRAIRRSCFPSKLPPGVGRAGVIFTAGKRQDTKSGAKASTVVTRCLDTEEFEHFHKHVAQIASPIEVLRAEDIHQAMYGHLLCLLAQADVIESIESVFAYSMAELFRSLEAWWPSLCHDIRTADVNKNTVTDSVIREAILSTVLSKPLPHIADRIQQEFEKGQRNGIVLRLFPNLQYLVCISTGPMKPFSTVLDRYTSRDFPKLAFGYGCSEAGHCAFALKKTLHDPEAFALWPKLAFYEFLPVTQDEAGAGEFAGVAGAVEYREEQKPAELTEVKLGQKYELIVTTAAGLYRYRTEDIFQVVDFHKSLPIFKFVCRKGVMLSINTDKTDEAELQNVVNKATGRLEQGLHVFLANYSSVADHSTTPGHYVIYWELENAPTASPSDVGQVLQECCDLLDSSLNEPYRRGRKNGSIGPLELNLVKQGTFTNLRNYALQRGSNLSQYKTPRCVVNPALSEILNDGVERSFRSSFTAWETVQNVGLKTF